MPSVECVVPQFSFDIVSLRFLKSSGCRCRKALEQRLEEVETQNTSQASQLQDLEKANETQSQELQETRTEVEELKERPVSSGGASAEDVEALRVQVR